MLEAKLTERDEMLERARDLMEAAWCTVERWREAYEAQGAVLEEERQERNALVQLEVDRLTGREPKPRGRPPSWSADSEAEVEIAAELHTSKTQVHRVITRVRRQQADAAERARLAAVAAGRSPKQRAAWAARQAAERRPVETYDPARAERGLEYLRDLPDDPD